jgi:hypothetical protein
MPKTGPKKVNPNPFKAIIQESGQSKAVHDPSVSITTETKVGRRSRAGYTQVGAYLPKALYKDVQRRLLDEDRNFSELVEDLLATYLHSEAGHGAS